MAITSYTLPSRTPSLVSLFAAGRLNVEAGVASSLRLFAHLGISAGRNLRKEFKADYGQLAGLGYGGRLYPELPADITDADLAEAMKAARPKGVSPDEVWDPFWTPGTKPQSATVNELNGSATGVTAKLAIHSATPGDYDPVLHFRGLAYDDMYRQPNKPTQLEMFQRTAEKFGAAHEGEGASLAAGDHRAYRTWVLMDRLDGVSPRDPKFILNQGFMRVPRLGRKSVAGVSCVGGVFSDGGRAYFGGSYGGAHVGYGFGLVAGFGEG